MTEREAFEAWAKQPPMEWGCDRFPDNGAWPGSYRYYPAQCAWEGWQAARAQPAQAGQAEAVPPGFVLVPVEPSPQIVAVMAVQEASGSINGTKTIGMAGAVAAYDAMITAAAKGEKP